MAYGYYMPVDACAYCPYVSRGDSAAEDSQGKNPGNAAYGGNPYYGSQYRVLPLVTIPLLAAASLPFLFGPRPFWGPQPYYYNYNYWYYNR